MKFTIIPKSLEDDDVTVTFSPESSYYTGQPITPDVTVKFGNIDLVRDRDYTLEWEDNTDAGTATVSVKAYSDNYTDTKTAEFTILAAPASGKVTITGADNKVGTELTASVTGNTHILFQFTPLREGRRVTLVPAVLLLIQFQFTPLREGRLFRFNVAVYGFFISIHAPARGATVADDQFVRGIIFQFTPLREGRLSTAFANMVDVEFQFTPLREGRPRASLPVMRFFIFQFTPLREGRPKSWRGGTNDFLDFNSRPCERGDLRRGRTFTAGRISIHAPARGATGWMYRTGLGCVISIHAPARGATAKLNKISVKFTEIIIKTEWEFKQYSSYGY